MHINADLLWMLTGTFAALCVGTVVRIVALRHADPDLATKRMGSLKVWWTLAALMSVAAVFERPAAAVLLAVASFLGLREFLQLIGKQRIGKAAKIVAYLSVPLQYLLIAMGFESEAKVTLPIGMLLLLSAVRLAKGDTQGFIRTTGSVYWGVMLLVYCLSHAAMLFTIAADHTPVVGASGWFLFVVIVTETDDIAQALIGRVIGRRKITPVISPNKTWEGFLGGVITSVVLSLLLAPWLTSFPSISTSRGLLLSVGSGLLIVTAAFLGDINMSAIKRDVGVKDGSSILPGMGGIIDRVDSLTFTAPAFYYFLSLVL
ncbi:MAG: CDP-archaeol synthase [Fuerstia sp.]|nr:CDP-archaeol synthase [Fuerstiella sp.]